MGTDLIQQFIGNVFFIKKKLLKIIGGEFRIYDDKENLLFFAEQEGLKLKEIFHIYTDEAKTNEIIGITTPHVIDFAASYEVKDTNTNEVYGAIKREGLKSIFMDEWTIMDNKGQVIGKLKEKSALGAFLSRWINIIPQHYVIKTPDDKLVAAIDQKFNPLILQYTMTIQDPNPALDKRLLLGMLVLLTAIEGRQK
ncbi:hypothetical protein KAU33_11160 [Candidatus Dependentiae bacterium]|nr:hypothetical protein [Candidatus Dependentiae bacterium]